MAFVTHPYLGFGLGLRGAHYSHILAHKPKVDFFEIISENFMDTEGKRRRDLARIRADYPLVMHGVALSIGTVDPLNSEYLQQLKALMQEIEPAWLSDHLCWTGVAHRTTHDLLPIPYTAEALSHVISRITQVQEFLGCQLVLENPSSYIAFSHSEMEEAAFISEMVKQSGCGLLLDINNVYVSSRNLGINPYDYINMLPMEAVAQIHLAGHSDRGTYLLDTHNRTVSEEVWALYRYTLHRAGRPLNTMIEWDSDIPSFETLYAELEKARKSVAVHDMGIHIPGRPHMDAEGGLPLAELQVQFQQALVSGSAAAQLPVYGVLEAYTDGYEERLLNAVAVDYPVLKHYLGDAAFRNLLVDFVRKVPATHYNLDRYSAALPTFIDEDTFARALAQLESAIGHVTHAPESRSLDADDLAAFTPDAFAEYSLHPRKALQLLALSYPVEAYYAAVSQGLQSVQPVKTDEYIVVFRHEDEVWRMTLEPQEYALLTHLFAGATIGEALAQTDVSEDLLFAWFGRWMRNGLLAA